MNELFMSIPLIFPSFSIFTAFFCTIDLNLKNTLEVLNIFVNKQQLIPTTKQNKLYWSSRSGAISPSVKLKQEKKEFSVNFRLAPDVVARALI